MSKYTTIQDCRLIDLRKIHDPRGNLTPIEGGLDVPFEIKRVFYQYDVPGGESRGAHAHIKDQQFLIAVSGAFEVLVDDGLNSKVFTLNRPYYGLLVPPGIWSAEQEFSSGSVCLVLTDNGYDAADYIRDYDEFIAYKQK
ncbi:MAG: WxcM-like domain-containing protein [Paludibacteraceae bacterium]|nr:WxcM-like domain-containing protein [Paludibacteraceae bacterium]